MSNPVAAEDISVLILGMRKHLRRAEELTQVKGAGGEELVRTLFFLLIATVRAMVTAEREVQQYQSTRTTTK